MNIIFGHTVRHMSPSLHILMSIMNNFPKLSFKAKITQELLAGLFKDLSLFALMIISYRLKIRLWCFILICRFFIFIFKGASEFFLEEKSTKLLWLY